MSEERFNTAGSDWQKWSVRLPVVALFGIVVGVIAGYNLHQQIHTNTSEILRVEGRFDKKFPRIEERVRALEKKNECE